MNMPVILFGVQKQKPGQNLTLWGYLEGNVFVTVFTGKFGFLLPAYIIRCKKLWPL